MKHTSKRPPKVSKNIARLLEDSAKDDLIITPSYNEFLATWDETYPPHVGQRIKEVLGIGQRDRRYSWSASAAGFCMRRQEFQFLGMPTIGMPSAQQRRIFLNGTWVHLRNQATLLSGGILDAIEVTHRKKSFRARCTLDGMGVAKTGRYEGADFIYELKSANEFAFQNQLIKGVSEKVRLQVDFQFLLTGFDLAVIFNENKNNQDIHEWVIVRDEKRVSSMAKQIKELNAAIDYEQLHKQLPECKKRLKSGQFYECPYGGDGGVCASTGTWPNRIPS